MPGFLLKLILVCPVTVRRRLWAILEHLGGVFYGRRRIPLETCQRLPFGFYMKYAYHFELIREMTIMKYVAARTAIPLPIPIDLICINEQTTISFMIMTRMPGEHADVALERMTPHERSLLAVDLRRQLDQLRNLPPPSPVKISGFDGGQCIDPRDRIAAMNVGPFEDEHALNSHLVRFVPATDRQNPVIMAAQAIQHRICLTHNDLHSRNVLVDKGRVSAILDWEGCGWYPEHWDYIISFFFVQDENWVQLMDETFPEYGLEMQAERLLWPYIN